MAAGDLIRVNDSVLSGSIGLLNELTAPMVGIYSAYPYSITVANDNQLNANQPNNPTILHSDDEIDLEVFGALLRHKALIAKITAASVVFAGLYAFTRNPIWQGQFEIVLANTSRLRLKPGHCFKAIQA